MSARIIAFPKPTASADPLIGLGQSLAKLAEALTGAGMKVPITLSDAIKDITIGAAKTRRSHTPRRKALASTPATAATREARE